MILFIINNRFWNVNIGKWTNELVKLAGTNEKLYNLKIRFYGSYRGNDDWLILKWS